MLTTIQFRISPSHPLFKKLMKILYTKKWFYLFCVGVKPGSRLREEHSLRVLENRVMRIFGRRRKEVMGGRENYIMKSFIVVLCTMWSDQGEWGRKASIMYGRSEKCIQKFGWKIWRKEPLGRPRRRWEFNNTMGLRELVWEVVEWIRLRLGSWDGLLLTW